MTEDLHGLLHTTIIKSDGPFDPRSAEHQRAVLRTADSMLELCQESNILREVGQAAIRKGNAPLRGHLAVKLALSKSVMRSIAKPIHVSVVFAMYKEHQRMLPPDEHAHGEDFLARKIAEMQWLFDDMPSATWDMFVVDDGCPENSGRLAEQILRDRFPHAPVRVLFLQDAIDRGLPVTRPMTSPADSQKGGSVVYGMWEAVRERRENHVVLFTDADLSTHLGQTGLLVEGIAQGTADAAIGSRREAASVVIKTGRRNTRGKLFIYLWKGLIRPLHYITDTQCGFKAFTADTVRDAFADIAEKRFAFDIELLLRTELRRSDSIRKIPIAWIDSEAASTTTAIQPYLPMLKSAAAMYRDHLPATPEADALADMITAVTEDQWAHLAENVPGAIADGDPLDFGRSRPVTPEDLSHVIST